MPRKAFSTPPSGGPSQRQLRAGELVRHALVEILAREDIRDPDLAGAFVTIAEVRISPDLKHATVFASLLGAADSAPAIVALNRAQAFLRGQLARRIELKFTPDLHFRLDESLEEAARIDRLLDMPHVRQDLASEARNSGAEDD